MLSRFALSSSALVLVLGLALGACGGVSSTDLFGPPDQSTSGTDPASSNGSSNANDAGSNASSTSNPNQNPSGTDAGNGFVAPDSGSSANGGANDAGNSSGSSGGSVVVGSRVYCGFDPQSSDAIFCDNGQLCCGTKPSGALNEDFACVATQSSCTGVPIGCDSTSECASGQVCCAEFDQTAGYKQISCQSSCTTSGTLTALVMCDPNQPGDCKTGTCAQSQSLNGFYYCAN